MTELPVFVSHGSWNAYSSYGCRCEPCRAAGSAYLSEHRTSEQYKTRWRNYMREYMRKYRAAKREQ